MLHRVISFGPDLQILDPDGTGGLKQVHRYAHYRIANRILWAAWRRLPGTRYSPKLPGTFSAAYADWLASRWVSASKIFHGWAGLSLISLQAAASQGAITMLENPIMHPSYWQQTVLEECEAFGVRPRDCRAVLHSALINRMEREYRLCDFIIVPSAVARDSFERAGHSGKAIVVHAGVDSQFFTPASVRDPTPLFRVCYTGRVELTKGVIHLLQAWKRLNLPNAELVLIGEVTPEMHPFLKGYALPNVRLTGFIAPAEVAGWYRRSHLFAFPSINEGLARVLFEAMSSGLPVVATAQSGAEECVTPGVDGTIVPARDANALAQTIFHHYQHREQTAAMGSAARSKIEQQFTLAHYEERMINIYASLPSRQSC
ncbi:MAG TPA: glycosyltransferase family 4 protein [Edaphobacter sp.]